MTPQDVFTPEELKSIMDYFRVAASGEAILSMKDTGFRPDIDRGLEAQKMEDAKGELDGYVSRYNAALIQAGKNPTDAAGLAWAIICSPDVITT